MSDKVIQDNQIKTTNLESNILISVSKHSHKTSKHKTNHLSKSLASRIPNSLLIV